MGYLNLEEWLWIMILAFLSGMTIGELLFIAFLP